MTSIRLTSGDAYLDGGELGDRRLVITVTQAGGAPVDLTGIDLVFMVKRRRLDADEDAVISKATPTDVEVDADPATGLAYVSIDAADTEDLSGRYMWELEATDSVGPLTLASGDFTVVGDLIVGLVS